MNQTEENFFDNCALEAMKAYVNDEEINWIGDGYTRCADFAYGVAIAMITERKKARIRALTKLEEITQSQLEASHG